MPQPNRIEVRDDYEYPRYNGGFPVNASRDLNNITDHLLRAKSGLSAYFPQAADDAKPLFRELFKILEAIDDSFGTDPATVAEDDGDRT